MSPFEIANEKKTIIFLVNQEHFRGYINIHNGRMNPIILRQIKYAY